MQKRVTMSKSFVFSSVSRNWLWFMSIGALMMIIVLLGTTRTKSNLDNIEDTKDLEHEISKNALAKGPNYPPVLAYWILGSKGDSKRMLRLLKALYHPRNQYLLQLDSEASDQERVELVFLVQKERVFRVFGNVNVVGKSYGVNRIGATGLSAMLHAAALLLILGKDWDWFINLSSSDYPLFTQDDILYALTCIPRDTNFLRFSNITESNEQYDFNQIVVDPNLYSKENSPIFYAREGRETPDAFKIFGGSPWSMLSRAFIEHCVKGWDNLPRKLLLYYTNMISPLESYFQTLICNSPEFQNTTLNHDLRYHVKGKLNVSQHEEFASNLAIFARTFEDDNDGNRAMEELDTNVLNRAPDGLVPGKWCINGSVQSQEDHHNHQGKVCTSWGDINHVEPGTYGVMLHKVLSKLSVEKESKTDLCSLYAV